MFIIDNIDFKNIIRTVMKALIMFIISIMLFPFGFVILPSYFIKLGLKKDNIHAIIASVAFFVLVSIILGPTFALIALMYICLVSFSIINLIDAGYDDDSVIMISFFGIMTFILLTSVFLKLGTNTSIPYLVEQMLREFMGTLKNLELDSSTYGAIVNMFKYTSNAIVKSVYALMGVFGFYISVLNVYISRDEDSHKFDEFRINNKFSTAIIGIFVICGLIYFINKNFGSYLIFNLITFAVYCFLLEGISVLLYYLRSLSKPYKVLAIVFSLFIPYVNYIYALVGVSDSFKNLRKRSNK